VDDNKVFDASFELPDGYEVQMMVLRDYQGGRARRGAVSVFRSRVWVGHVSESDPLLHRSQEHPELNVAIDACYSMLLQGAGQVVDSPGALEAIREKVHAYFHGIEQVG
jgi:hypothetical protein